MKDTFFRLSEEKQKVLTDACISEFSLNHFNSSSINRIILKAGISKGGLFKYTDGKNDLYMFIVTGILEKLIQFQAKLLNRDKDCFFVRIRDLLESGFKYYRQNPSEYTVIVNAMTDLTSPLYEEVMKIRNNLIGQYQSDLLENIDWEQYSYPKDDILRISSYLIDGFNLSLLKLSGRVGKQEFLKSEMVREIDKIIRILKKGVTGDVNA